MKITKTIPTLFAALLGLALITPAFAADASKAPEEKTFKGEMKCGKCALKESDTCQNVLLVKKDDKEQEFWLAENEVSKAFHTQVCKETKKVTVTGKVTKEGKKKILTADKIEVAEAKAKKQ
jgi:hypothetical protein